MLRNASSTLPKSSSTYQQCIQKFKNEVKNKINTRFPLNKDRIFEEVKAGILGCDDFLPLLLRVRIPEIILNECLNYILQDYPNLWDSDAPYVHPKLMTADLKYLFLYAVIIAPFLEELIFRGIATPLFSSFAEKLHLQKQTAHKVGVMASSTIFAAGHPRTSRITTGIMAAKGFEVQVSKFNGSLWSSIAMHATNNALALTGIVAKRAFKALIG